MRYLLFALCLSVASISDAGHASNPACACVDCTCVDCACGEQSNAYGIVLNPGETLISVGGVPVYGAVVVDRPLARVATAPIRAVHSAVRAVASPRVYAVPMRCVGGNCR